MSNLLAGTIFDELVLFAQTSGWLGYFLMAAAGLGLICFIILIIAIPIIGHRTRKCVKMLKAQEKRDEMWVQEKAQQIVNQIESQKALEEAERAAQEAAEHAAEVEAAMAKKEGVIIIPRVAVEELSFGDIPEEYENHVKAQGLEDGNVVVVPRPEPVQEEAVEEIVEEVVEEYVQEPVEEVVSETATTEEVEGEAVEGEGLEIRRVPFAEKVLTAEGNVQNYFDTLNNEFHSYRKINIRISTKGVSYRLGRELVAKITMRGKTLKLHLALDVNAYPENLYFQKDQSDVKEYAEVPFTVKVKSDRALKRAQELIGALAIEKGIESKTRWMPIDSIEDLKAWYK